MATEKEFYKKADKWLSWCRDLFEKMRSHGQKGDIEKVEREFVSILIHLNTVHQALCDASKKANLKEWREELENLRYKDELLFYIWKARDSEVHNALVKWRDSMKMTEYRVKEPERVQAIVKYSAFDPREAQLKLWQYIYCAKTEKEMKAKILNGEKPDAERISNAGLELIHSLDTLALDDFYTGRGKKKKLVRAPEWHLGELLPPAADEVIKKAMGFYENKLIDLKSKMEIA
jgi:hypothetical protein